mmetsp:Transcript_28327/g.111235  ORF Transcript_28327/g.111235 Transcript_28327/m.111235 type:complete len:115 (+) Transcript_28327:317-661(+)
MEQVRSSVGWFEEWIHRKILVGLLRRRASRHASYPFLLLLLDLLYMISITTVAIVLQSAYVGFYVTMVCIRAIDLATILILNMPWGLVRRLVKRRVFAASLVTWPELCHLTIGA